MQAKLLHF